VSINEAMRPVLAAGAGEERVRAVQRRRWIDSSLFLAVGVSLVGAAALLSVSVMRLSALPIGAGPATASSEKRRLRRTIFFQPYS
jgi:hypothetical protein